MTLCTVCGTVLDPAIPAEGHTTHPCCDPGPREAARAWRAAQDAEKARQAAREAAERVRGRAGGAA